MVKPSQNTGKFPRGAVRTGTIAVLVCLQATCHSALAFAPEKTGFAVKFKEEISPYRIMGIYVLPGEKITLEVLHKTGEDQYEILAPAGKLNQTGPHQWRWQAPQETGLYPVTIRQAQATDSMTLNVFVMVPYARLQGEYLNGYRIGKYPSIPFKQLPIYKPPKGFIEITPENEETLISPHFRLKQFVSKQGGSYPRYAVLRERLLLKLELILEKVNEKGYACETFEIMSGYRTPHYNKVIKNVKYSRHIYGGAADIFIDLNPKDGMMDDLNADGKINYHDADILYDIIDALYGRAFYTPFVGGLGRYMKTATHGPFVHVDVRGFRARWGT